MGKWQSKEGGKKPNLQNLEINELSVEDIKQAQGMDTAEGKVTHQGNGRGSVISVLGMIQAMLQSIHEQTSEALQGNNSLIRLAAIIWDCTTPLLGKTAEKNNEEEEDEHVRVALVQLFFTLKSLHNFIQDQARPSKHVMACGEESTRRLDSQVEGKQSELYASVSSLAIALHQSKADVSSEASESARKDIRGPEALQLLCDELNDPSFEGAVREMEEAMEKRREAKNLRDQTALDMRRFPWSLDLEELDYETTGRGRPRHVLGKGGFGLVYRGTYRGTEVAIKEPHDPSAVHEDEEQRKSFLREADNLYQLSHRNVVELVGAVMLDEGGEPCYMLVSELLAQTLESEMERLRDLDKEEQRQRQEGIMLGLAEGLAYLHSMGIIHKDIKPQNVMIGRDLSPKYIDFGLSKVESVATSAASTRLAGSLYWMSPERKEGGSASAKSDVYALGLLLVYVQTTGLIPGTEEEQEEAIREDAGELAGKLALCCLRKERTARPSAATVAMSLLLHQDVTVSPLAELKVILEVQHAQLRKDWKQLAKILQGEHSERIHEEVMRTILEMTDGKEILPGRWKGVSQERTKELCKLYNEMWTAGVIQAVIEGMKMWVSNFFIQEFGAEILMLSAREDQKKSLVTSTRHLPAGVEAIIHGMIRHRQHAGVQQKGCGALMILAINDFNSSKIGAMGGIEVVIGTMSMFSDAAYLQELCCGVLRNLTYNDVHKEKVREAGGIEAIVKSMQKHRGQAGVQEWGGAALRNLAYADENKRRIRDVAGIDAVIQGMYAHSNHEDVQEWGCAVLDELSNDPTNLELILQEEGDVAIARAIATFPTNSKIKFSGGRVLSRVQQ
eukprot:759421-Hanusia_phi.AAC.2